MVRTSVVIGLSVQVGLLAVLAAKVGLTPVGWLAGAAVGVITSQLLAGAVVRSGETTWGAANSVTFARAVLVGGVAALVADSFVRVTSTMAIAAIASVALILDAVDGQVARRTATVSVIGARFDMEVDAFLIFALSVFEARTVGAWVLAIGVARYAFVAAGWVLPWLREPVPPRYWCKVVAVIQGIALTIAVANIWAGPAIKALLLLALALLAESFGREIWWLWRHSACPREDVRPVEVVLAGPG